MSVPEISVQELKRKKEAGEKFILLDVREPDEFEIANLGGLLIPMNEIPDRLSELNPDVPLVVQCHHGGRSARVTKFLLSKGFKDVVNLDGGIDAWSREIDSSIERY